MTAAIGSRATLPIRRHRRALPPYLARRPLRRRAGLRIRQSLRIPRHPDPAPRRLHLTRHSQVFTEQSVVESITEVLNDSGLTAATSSSTSPSNTPSATTSVNTSQPRLHHPPDGARRHLLLLPPGSPTARSSSSPTTRHRTPLAAPAPSPTWPSTPATPPARRRLPVPLPHLGGPPAATSERDYDYLRPNLDIRGTAVVEPTADEKVVVWSETAKTVARARSPTHRRGRGAARETNRIQWLGPRLRPSLRLHLQRRRITLARA